MTHKITDYWEDETINFPPFIAVGNGELSEPLGETAECPKCGKACEVTYGYKTMPDGTKVRTKELAFVLCCDATYLVGINGKRWRGKKT